MTLRISLVAVLVADYDEAIRFYCGVLGFGLLEDTDLGGGKRWVRVAPAGGKGTELLLARAVNDQQSSCVGHQSGGRVFLFMETDDIQRDYQTFSTKGVKFLAPPREEPYGSVAVFVDLYGNKIDLIEPRHVVPAAENPPM